MKKFIFDLQRFDYITNSDTRALITGTDIEDTIKNDGGTLSTIIAGAGDDSIVNWAGTSNVTIFGGAGSDTVSNSGKSVLINTGGGDDYVDSSGIVHKYVTILTGTGNDTVTDTIRYRDIDDNQSEETYGTDVIIATGDGDDYIKFDSTFDFSYTWATFPVSVYAGAGNDFVQGDSSGRARYNIFYQYDAGDGDDIITGFGEYDTIQIATSLSYSTTRSGDDVILSFDDGGSLTLLNGADVSFYRVSGRLPASLNTAADPMPSIGTATVATVEPVTVPATSATISSVDTTPAATSTETTSGGTTNIYNGTVYNGPVTINNVSNETNVSTTNVANTAIDNSTTNTTNNTVVDNSTTNNTSVNNTSNTNNIAIDNSTTDNSTTNNVSNTSTVSNVTNNTTVNNYFDFRTTAFTGGNQTISDYTSGEKINYAADFTGINFNATDFMINSSSGALTIQNARDKVIDVAVNNNTVAYAFMASGDGEIDGSSFSPLEVILGANDSDNNISAGSGGSSLWGGAGGSDILNGGAGVDEIFFGKNDGADVINNAGSADVINLYDVTLADISSVNYVGNSIFVGLNTGGSLQINSASSTSSKFMLADGSNWRFNHSSGEWQSA